MERMLADLEFEFEATMDELKIDDERKVAVRSLLAILKQKSQPTYAHSLRVALLSRRIARFMHLDETALFLAGSFHDLGKSLIPLSTLHKTSGWMPQDTETMKGHVLASWQLLRDKFDFSADIVLWHHRFQKDPYPVELPELLHHYSEGTRVLIQEYGRILAIADVYDALHRKNDKFEDSNGLADEQIREKMFEFNPDRKPLIEELYNVGILERGAIPTDTPDQELYEQAWSEYESLLNGREIGRLVMLAAALEPLADKAGCTTRFTDISRHLKLEYFITASINLGEAFELLANRASELRELDYSPTGLYDFVLRAQKESLRNRSGGRINQGIIELLVPIVAGQHYFDNVLEKSVDGTIEKATRMLKRTGRIDVASLIEMKSFAYNLCRYNGRPIPEHKEARNVFEYYSADLASSTNPTGVAHNGEFVNGFPTVRLMYDSVMNSSKRLFIRKVEEAFRHGVKFHDKGVGRGFLADCTAAAIYLCLSQNPSIQLVV